MGEPGESFGNLLRHYRQAARLTQEELAERADLSTRAVSDLERGLRARPYRHTVRQLTQALALARDDRLALETAARSSQPPTPPDSLRAERRFPVGGYLGAAPSGPLVAREGEMAQIRASVEAVAQGEGRLVLVAGEPGIGKTRLAQ